MKLHELRAVPGATKAPKRKGRGTATGQGKTAGQWYERPEIEKWRWR